MPYTGIFVRGVCPYIRPVQGTKFGVEIEAEGINIPRPDFSSQISSDDDEEPEYNDSYYPHLIPHQWRPEKENSLRGEGCEYVFDDPLCLEESLEAIDDLRAMFVKAGSTLNRNSTRTSTHIHTNVSDFKAGNLGTFLAMYLLMEDMLFEILPPIRQRNLFCLRTRHAPATLLFWRKLFCSSPGTTDNTNLRYSALSVQSLFKYGTLEFRGGHGPAMEDDYWLFVKGLVRFFANIREVSISNPNPVDFLGELRTRGAHAFYAEHFYPYFGAVPGVSEFRFFEKSMASALTLVKDVPWKEEPEPYSAFDPAVVPIVDDPAEIAATQTQNIVDVNEILPPLWAVNPGIPPQNVGIVSGMLNEQSPSFTESFPVPTSDIEFFLSQYPDLIYNGDPTT